MLLPSTLTSLLVSLLNLLISDSDQESITPKSLPLAAQPLQFQLRHVHAISPAARVVFADVQRSTSTHIRHIDGAKHNGGDTAAMAARDETYEVRTRLTKSFRPASHADFEAARVWSARFGQSRALDWDGDEVEGPDVESRDTLLQLAKMTNNAYVDPQDAAWYDLGDGWNASYPFGWEPDADGFRGHVFATPDNKTVVISIKGTSAGLLGSGGPTVRKDKLNDNLLFSCCCARVDWTWTTVCGCYRGGWKCDQDCLEDALIEESLFYPIGTNLYNNLTYMYPDSNIWVVGHSLGGSLASLLGVTFGAPVVAFEAPGEKRAAQRLHLPSPPSTQHITHIYHTADPIPMGTCTGVLSSCALAGYALETHCHLGKTILYDTVSNMSWTVDVRTHGIVAIIDKLLAQPWAPSVEQGREVPEAKPEDDCVDCYSWEYGDFSDG